MNTRQKTMKGQEIHGKKNISQHNSGFFSYKVADFCSSKLQENKKTDIEKMNIFYPSFSNPSRHRL